MKSQKFQWLRNLWQNDLATLLVRMVLVYVLLMVLRVIFYLYNIHDMGALTWGEIPMLLRGALLFDSANVAYVFGLFVVLSLLPFRFRQRRWYQWMLFGIYSLGVAAVVFFNTSDSVYFHYAKKRATIDEFSYADNGNTLAVMGKSALENWYLVLIGVLIIVCVLRIYSKVQYYPFSRWIRGSWRYYTVNTVIFVVAVFALVTMMRGGVGRAIRPINLSNAAQYTLSPQKATALLSNPFCILRTMGKSMRYTKYFEQSVVDSLYSPYRVPSTFVTDSSVVDAGGGVQKNVVIFILESFSSEHSAYLNPGLYGAGESYMPFLDSLMQQGCVMRNAYANGAKSIDALPSILASIPSYKVPFVNMPQSLSDIRGLGDLLGERGYKTWFFNGSERSSMGFVAFAQLAGFTEIRTREDYERTRGAVDYDGFWGIWDEPFLGYMGRELSSSLQPFVAATFTLSSHHPFVVPDEFARTHSVGQTAVHRPVAYTDRAFARFFDYARTQPWYDNTIFVFVADHVSSETFSPVTRTTTGGSHIVYFLFEPSSSSLPRDYYGVTSQVDVMPTVLGLLGYSEPYFAFGRDVFGAVGSSAPSGASGAAGDRGNYAVNYRGGVFQLITDSTSYLFDEQKFISAYDHRRDPLQKIDILGRDAAADRRADTIIKAAVQGYYSRVEASDFGGRR